jgi:hypothetical protein
VIACPLLSMGAKAAADAESAAFGADDESADECVAAGMEMAGDDDFDPSDDPVVERGDEDGVVVGRGEVLEALGHYFRRCGIAKLSAEFGDGSGIVDGDWADSEGVGQRAALRIGHDGMFA